MDSECKSGDPKSAIYAVLRAVPPGRVATYGQIAELAGLPRAARLVGTTLKNLPGDSSLPWHRVINASGRISFPATHPHHHRQRQLLVDEGVLFVGNRVKLSDFQWRPGS